MSSRASSKSGRSPIANGDHSDPENNDRDRDGDKTPKEELLSGDEKKVDKRDRKSRKRHKSKEGKKKRKKRSKSNSESASSSDSSESSESSGSSRSRSRKRKKHKKHRSRSGSRSRKHKKRSRRRSRSYSADGAPMLPPRRYPKQDGRDAPEPYRCLGVFGLSLYTTEKDLHRYFSKFGHLEKVQLIYDHYSNTSRGFGFVYYENMDDAIEAREHCVNGVEMDGRKVRVDYSVTRRPRSPTPGQFMGGYDRGGGGSGYYR